VLPFGPAIAGLSFSLARGPFTGVAESPLLSLGIRTKGSGRAPAAEVMAGAGALEDSAALPATAGAAAGWPPELVP
jgi:hypothetical protein